MFAVKRNQVVVTALAVMIAAAGYLNFTESRSSGDITDVDLNDPTSYEALLNDDGSIATIADDADTDGLEIALGIDDTAEVYDDTGAAVYVSAQATEMINNTNVDDTKKQECADNLLEIQQRIEKETAAEAMIESKGFSEAYVRIDDDTVDVVVNKSELTDTELAQIMDIVTRKTGMSESQVRISPLKSQTAK